MLNASKRKEDKTKIMNKKEETVLGYPRGRVAETLRRILYRDLRNNQVETIVTVLFSHLLVEDAIEKYIFKLLTFALPGGKARPKLENKFWKNIQRMPFMKKLELITPVLDNRQRKMVEDINTVRNDIIHVRKKTDAIVFKGKSIWKEETIVKYFDGCQGAFHEISDLSEWVDHLFITYKRWAKELEKRGIPLL